MAKRIKGITIELDGETKGLDKALQSVNKRSINLQSELKDVNKLLKFDPNNTELLAQKQKLLGDQVENTTQKLSQLKNAQSQVEAQFKSGDIGEEQYRAFQREIVSTEAELNKFKKALASVDNGSSLKNLRKDLEKVEKEAQEAKDSLKDMSSEMTATLGAIAAGGGIAGAVNKALDTSSLNTKIDISMEVPKESIESVRASIKTVESYGIDAEASLEGVRRQWALNKDASDEANAAIVKGAGTIATAYSGIDFTELIQETNEISKELNITNEEALGLTNSLLKIGFPPEQLDIIAEYGKQLTDAGFNAQEVQAVMAAGVETGTWNIDNLLDGLKEGRIKLEEFGQEVPKATAELLEGTNISKQELQKWGQEVAKGGETGRKAMETVAQELLKVEDETKRNALGVSIFGTMWEDQGTNITDTILNMDNHLKTTKENQDQLNQSVEGLDNDPAVQMQQAIQKLNESLQPLFQMIANVVTKIAEWVSENPQLAATITAIVTVLGILMGVFLALSPIITAIIGLAGTLGVSIGAIAAPIAIAVAAIAAIIAIGVLLYKNWDTISAKAKETWDGLSKFIAESWESIKKTTSETWDSIKKWLSDTWDSIKKTSRKVWDSMKKFFLEHWDEMLAIATGVVGLLVYLIINNWDKIKKTTSDVWNSIKKFFSDTWNGIKAIFNNMISTIVNYVVSRFNTLKNNISTIFNNVKNTISNIWGNIKSFFSNALNNIVSTVSNRFSSMISTVRERMYSVYNNIRDIWNNVKSFLYGVDLRSIGKNIIQGLINGVKSMASSVVNSVRGVVNDAISGAKRLLGIHSPSRVFKQIGVFTGEGFEIGINSMVRDIQKASDNMTAASIPDLPKVDQLTTGINNISSSHNADSSNIASIIADAISKLPEKIIVQSLLNGRVIAESIQGDMTRLQTNTKNRTLRQLRGSTI